MRRFVDSTVLINVGFLHIMGLYAILNIFP